MAVDPAPFSSTKIRGVETSARIVAILEIAAAPDREALFYNLDIPTPQRYLYLTKLFPLCRLEANVDEHGNVIETAVTDSARVSSPDGHNCESCAAAGSALGRRRNRPRDLRPHKFSKETVTRPLPNRHPCPVSAQIDLWFIGGARAGRREPMGALMKRPSRVASFLT